MNTDELESVQIIGWQTDCSAQLSSPIGQPCAESRDEKTVAAFLAAASTSRAAGLPTL